MLRRFLVVMLAVALASATASTPSLAHYDERDANRDCERAIVDAYGHQEFYGEQWRETGSDSYELWGMVRVSHGHDQAFSCRISHREVVSARLRPKSGDDDDGGFSAGTAAAVGVGVIGLAALAALAASADDDHAEQRTRYQSAHDADPLADRAYLEKECEANLVSHIQHDHGSVERLRLVHAHLDGRDLRGQGEVRFRSGGDRRLEFTCAFDRQGRIHDGSYRYY
jgi:hypothetical protein